MKTHRLLGYDQNCQIRIKKTVYVLFWFVILIKTAVVPGKPWNWKMNVKLES